MDQEMRDSFLLHCLNLETDEINAARSKQLSSSDWDGVVQQSIKHRVTPLLYRRLKPNTYVPDEVMQRLRAIYLQNAMRNTRLYNELSRVLMALKSEDIPIMVLKGAVLAEVVYQNIGLRAMADMDLLAKSEDIQRVYKSLAELGYKSSTRHFLSKRYIQWFQNAASNKVLSLEIHPRIHELSNLNIWINASTAEIAGASALIPGSEDLLLYLCLHLDKHFRRGEAQLIWWYDIATVLRHYREEINWDYVAQTAKKHRFEGSISRVLSTTNKLFSEHASGDVLNQFKDDDAAISINNVLHPVKVQSRQLHQFSFPRIPSIHNKIYHVLRSLFPCREFMMHRYSITRPNYVYFYYFVRVWTGIVKVVKVFFHQRPAFEDKKERE